MEQMIVGRVTFSAAEALSTEKSDQRLKDIIIQKFIEMCEKEDWGDGYDSVKLSVIVKGRLNYFGTEVDKREKGRGQ